MAIPLIILAIGAVLTGYIGLPQLSLIDGWLEPVFHAGAEAAGGHNVTLEIILLVVSALVALGGAFAAYRAYVVDPDLPKRARASLGWFARLVENKYYVDEAYNMLVVHPLRAFGGWLAQALDTSGLAGAAHGLAGVTSWIGGQARRLQSGMVGMYALAMLFGAVALLAWLVIR